MSDDVIEELPPKKKKAGPVKYSWTQPCCLICWQGLKLKIGKVNEQLTDDHVACCYCRVDIARGVTTYAIRINPGSVPYPTLKAEGDH